MSEACPLGIALMDLNRNYQQVCNAFCEVTGHTRAVLTSLHAQTLTHPDDRVMEVEQIHRILQQGAHQVAYEKRYVHGAGHHVRAIVNIRVVRNEHGEPAYLTEQILEIVSSATSSEVHPHATR